MQSKDAAFAGGTTSTKGFLSRLLAPYPFLFTSSTSI
jgi:hypothetical protein